MTRTRTGGFVLLIVSLLLGGCGMPGGGAATLSPDQPAAPGLETAAGLVTDEGDLPGMADRSLVVTEVDQRESFVGSEDECKAAWCQSRKGQQGFMESIHPSVGSAEAPLYFILSVHTCDDKLVRDVDRFHRGTISIRKMQDLLGAYKGKLSFQVSMKWAEYEHQFDTGTLSWLAQQGSEIALHIHEEYLLPVHLGLPYGSVEDVAALVQEQPEAVLAAAFQELKAQVEHSSGAEVVAFTGAPFCAERFEIASQVGLTVSGGYKNPDTHLSDWRVSVLNPWRPVGSASIEALASFDPGGGLVYVPSGVIPVHCRDAEGIPTPFNYAGFDYVTFLLRENLRHVEVGKINVFSVMFHPWDFESEADFRLWREWLDSVVRPLLGSGRLLWGTLGDVADHYAAWESENISK